MDLRNLLPGRLGRRTPLVSVVRLAGVIGRTGLLRGGGLNLDGLEKVIERAFAPAGKMVYLGRTGQRAPVFLDRLVSGAASIVGARGHAGGGCFPSIIRLLERGRMDPSPMITARFPFEQVIAALERSSSRLDGKIMVGMETVAG